jgi:hypothetical protein
MKQLKAAIIFKTAANESMTESIEQANLRFYQAIGVVKGVLNPHSALPRSKKIKAKTLY